jgi:FlaA1/EpsC-like NDP-sugar epimerase
MIPFHQREDGRRALIVGAGSGGRIIADELIGDDQWGLEPIGFVDDDATKAMATVEGLPVLGDISAIPEIVTREQIQVIVLAMPSAAADRLASIATLAKSTGAEILTMPPIGSILSGSQRAQTLRQVRISDVLERPRVDFLGERRRAFVAGKRVLITGASGSIGSELAEQVAELEPEQLLLLDTNESGLYDLHLDLAADHPELNIVPIIASVSDYKVLDTTFARYRPQIVFHAAAYKHVPLMEQFPGEAVRTNVLGTDNVARLSAATGVERFVLVSSDKAVNPTSVMGATKRLAEAVLSDVSRDSGLSSCSVRFGNVLGSRGSVIPTFERQIRRGGPVTVTDRRMRRYFMTVNEAVNLIILSGAFGDRNAIFILDMGDDVSILELAERVIRLHGLRPYQDIPIEFTGIRPGEKLREDLAHDFEEARLSPHPKIRSLRGSNGGPSIDGLSERMMALFAVARTGTHERVRRLINELVEQVDSHDRECHFSARAMARPQATSSAMVAGK